MIPKGKFGSNFDSDPSEVQQTMKVAGYQMNAWFDTLWNSGYDVEVNGWQLLTGYIRRRWRQPKQQLTASVTAQHILRMLVILHDPTHRAQPIL